MKLNKRLASLLVTTMVLSSMPQVVWAKDYDNHWAAEAITKWKNKGIINGFEDGTFRPKEAVTKAQFAKILVELFGYTEVEGAKEYQDVATNKWYSDYITQISASGIMYEVGAYFNPNTPITREEAAYALANAYKMTGEVERNKAFNDESLISDWALETVVNLHEAGYIQGTPEGNFNPKGSLSRAEIITMIDRINSEVINVRGTYSQDIKGNLVVNTRDVVLKDMTITGNLYLAEGIGDGDIDLENVKVEGKVFVEGGGINSIKSKNCNYLQSMQVSAKNPVRVVIEGDGVRIEALEGTQVTLTGNFEKVTVAQDVQMIIKDAKVETVVIAQGTKEGEAAKIEIAAGSTVETIQADHAAAIIGEGKVGELIANANDIKIEQKPDKVTIGEKDVVVNVEGKDQTQSTTTPDANNGQGNNSNNSNSSDSSDSDDSSDDWNKPTDKPSDKPNDKPSDSEENLAPTYRISGTVMAEQLVGEQLKDVAEGATIQFYEVTDEGTRYITTVYTDEKGAYSVNLDSGKTYQIQAWINDTDNNGYFYSQTLSPLKQNLDTYNFTLMQFPVANITIVDENDRPIKDVKIVPMMNGEESGTSYTGYEGSEIRYLWGDDATTFNFDFYLAGVKVEPSTKVEDITVGEVKENHNYRLDLKVTLPYSIPNTVTGTLVAEDGEALKNYSVRLVRRKHLEGNTTEWISQVETQTDENGVFTFENVDTHLALNEHYVLSVRSRDDKGNSYDTDSRNCSLYALLAQDTIKLQQTYGVVVQVIDKKGNPIQDANVLLQGSVGNSYYTSGTYTNEKGIADIHSTYIEPIKNTLTVTYKDEVFVTEVQMIEGTYNYEEVVQLDVVTAKKKSAHIQLVDSSITVGDETLTAKKVGLIGKNHSTWADINENGEANITLYEEDTDLEVRVVGENGEVLYKEKIGDFEETFSKTIDLSSVPKYNMGGQLVLVNSLGEQIVTTGASIRIYTNNNHFDYTGTLVATRGLVGGGYVQTNLAASSAYLFVAHYEAEGKKYIGRMFLSDYYMGDRVAQDHARDIYLYEAAEVNVKVEDASGKPLSHTSVYISGEKYITDENGCLTYEAEMRQEMSFYVSGKSVQEMTNELEGTSVQGNTIKVKEDMNLTLVVE